MREPVRTRRIERVGRIWVQAEDEQGLPLYAVRPGECIEGGLNWPLCALGLNVHRRCLEHWRAESIASGGLRPV